METTEVAIAAAVTTLRLLRLMATMVHARLHWDPMIPYRLDTLPIHE
jgi:hypothetical protein